MNKDINERHFGARSGKKNVNQKRDRKIYIYILGVSPSLVSRYCEGYSFWGISVPYI
jgi:hypothetical protein